MTRLNPYIFDWGDNEFGKLLGTEDKETKPPVEKRRYSNSNCECPLGPITPTKKEMKGQTYFDKKDETLVLALRKETPTERTEKLILEGTALYTKFEKTASRKKREYEPKFVVCGMYDQESRESFEGTLQKVKDAAKYETAVKYEKYWTTGSGLIEDPDINTTELYDMLGPQLNWPEGIERGPPLASIIHEGLTTGPRRTRKRQYEKAKKTYLALEYMSNNLEYGFHNKHKGPGHGHGHSH